MNQRLETLARTYFPATTDHSMIREIARRALSGLIDPIDKSIFFYLYFTEIYYSHPSIIMKVQQDHGKRVPSVQIAIMQDCFKNIIDNWAAKNMLFLPPSGGVYTEQQVKEAAEAFLDSYYGFQFGPAPTKADDIDLACAQRLEQLEREIAKEIQEYLDKESLPVEPGFIQLPSGRGVRFIAPAGPDGKVDVAVVEGEHAYKFPIKVKEPAKKSGLEVDRTFDSVEGVRDWLREGANVSVVPNEKTAESGECFQAEVSIQVGDKTLKGTETFKELAKKWGHPPIHPNCRSHLSLPGRAPHHPPAAQVYGNFRRFRVDRVSALPKKANEGDLAVVGDPSTPQFQTYEYENGQWRLLPPHPF